MDLGDEQRIANCWSRVIYLETRLSSRFHFSCGRYRGQHRRLPQEWQI